MFYKYCKTDGPLGDEEMIHDHGLVSSLKSILWYQFELEECIVPSSIYIAENKYCMLEEFLTQWVYV